MKNRNKLTQKLSRDVKRLENKIEHRTLYNIRDYAVTTLIKSGIAIDYALPFILASIITALLYSNKENAPFLVDNVVEKANVETTDTSNGLHFERISYDFEYSDSKLEHSTAWTTNKSGLYERTITSYRINDDIDLTKTEELLSMSKEELENIFVITNIQKICKDTLTKEDEIYDNDMIIIVNHIEKDDEKIVRPETTSENIINSTEFIVLSLFLGSIINCLERIFVKTYIKDKLKEYEPLFRPLRKKDLEKAKQFLEIKKQNLKMIDESSNNIGENNEHPYRLRKDKTEGNKNNQYVLKY